MRIHTKAAIGAALLLASSAVLAQEPLARPATQQEAAQEAGETGPNFSGAAQRLMATQAALMSTLGLEQEAGALAARSAALAASPSRDEAKEVLALQASANLALQRKMQGTVALDADARKKFSTSLRELADAYAQYAALAHDLGPLRKQAAAAGALEPYLAKAVPGAMPGLLKTLAQGAAFSRANAIPVSPVVTEILSRR